MQLWLTSCLLLGAVCTGTGHVRTRLELGTQELDPEPESVGDLPSPAPFDPCTVVTDCNITCTLPDLVVATIDSTKYTCPDFDVMTFTVLSESDDAVVRLRLDAESQLAEDESLAVLEDGVEMAVLTGSGEQWAATRGPNITLEYQRSNDSASQIHLTLVAYNQTLQKQTVDNSITGVFTAPEQTNFTGLPDYAINSERYWFVSLDAHHINFTVKSLDLDPASGDVLIIGAGSGPWDTEPVADLLTGRFTTRRYHVPGGEAFVYLLSRGHGKPRSQLEISYQADPIVGTTTTVPTTTDRDHPPTPADADFQLEMFITGIDPHRFMDANDTAASALQQALADYADFYRRDHGIPVWRSVTEDDIQFTNWLLCDYASGWVMPDPNCVRVSWYIELLTVDGDWAFLEPDLRGVITEYGDTINRENEFQVSLALEEVNQNWWWAITIILVPVALVAFLGVMWLGTNSTKRRSVGEKNSSIADSEEGMDEHMTNIDLEVRRHKEEKDSQMRDIFPDDDGFQDYDPEIHPGAHRRRAPQPHLSQQPLKSALKAPRPPPPPAAAAAAAAAYTNAAFEGDESTPLSAGGRAGPPTDQRGTAAVTPAPAAAAAVLPAQPASSELTEQLRLLNELNKTLKEEERQQPGIELPRVNQLVQPAAPGNSKLYSMNDDGTGTEVAEPVAGENIIQLDNNSSSSNDRKTSSV